MLVHGAKLRRVLAPREVLKKELVHFGLWDAVVLQSVVEAELALFAVLFLGLFCRVSGCSVHHKLVVSMSVGLLVRLVFL